MRSLRHDVTRPLPLAGGAFDCVLCCLVAEHIPDLAALFPDDYPEYAAHTKRLIPFVY